MPYPISQKQFLTPRLRIQLAINFEFNILIPHMKEKGLEDVRRIFWQCDLFGLAFDKLVMLECAGEPLAP